MSTVLNGLKPGTNAYNNAIASGQTPAQATQKTFLATGSSYGSQNGLNGLPTPPPASANGYQAIVPVAYNPIAGISEVGGSTQQATIGTSSPSTQATTIVSPVVQAQPGNLTNLQPSFVGLVNAAGSIVPSVANDISGIASTAFNGLSSAASDFGSAFMSTMGTGVNSPLSTIFNAAGDVTSAAVSDVVAPTLSKLAPFLLAGVAVYAFAESR